jgi:long-subunit acyl-CoA synthetase (AMP-forming)
VLTPEFFGYETVGCLMPSIESKLVDVEDAGYFVSNNPPQGEIWIRGNSVAKGYCSSLSLSSCSLIEFVSLTPLSQAR